MLTIWRCPMNLPIYVLTLSLVLVLSACGTPATSPDSETRATSPASSISAQQASLYVGETTTVCGTVVDSRYAKSSRGSPTFLNFDGTYPRHVFTVVIWENSRRNFPSKPESHYRNKRVCASGTIDTYGGKPQIEVRSNSQLQIVP